MNRVLITISTYQKSNALLVLLDTLIAHGYDKGNRILVTDDNAGEGYTVTKKDNPNHPLLGELDSLVMDSAPAAVAKFKELHPEVEIECVFGKKRGGVAINKNRGIKYFLENKEFTHLLMLDDDIQFIKPGLIDLMLESKMQHLTGYLGSPSDPFGTAIKFGSVQNPFFQTFPPQGENEYAYFCGGCQGVLLWCDRDTVEKVGYMDLGPDYYGFDHSLWSNRINMLHGKYMDWFPVLKGCGQFFITQEVPNNYVADWNKNQKYWEKRKPEIFKGLFLSSKRSGLD